MMKKDYVFKNTDNYPFIYDSKISNMIENYATTLQIASHFMMMLLHESRFVLELIKEEHTKTDLKLILKASTKEKSVFLTVVNDILQIQYENEEYTFVVNWDVYQSYATLRRYQIILPDKQIIEEIDAHHIKIEMTIKDKIFQLYIPYGIDHYLDSTYFNEIKESSSIMDLKRIYMERFFHGQTSFEMRIDTILSTKQKLATGEIILLDELSIKDGFVEKYILSSFKEGLLISVIGAPNINSEIRMVGYENTCTINLKEEIDNLYKRSRKVNFKC